MLTKDPALRPSSALDVRGQLQRIRAALLEDETRRVAPAPPPDQPARTAATTSKEAPVASSSELAAIVQTELTDLPAAPPPARRWPVAVLLLLLGAAVVGGVGVLAFRPTAPIGADSPSDVPGGGPANVVGVKPGRMRLLPGCVRGQSVRRGDLRDTASVCLCGNGAAYVGDLRHLRGEQRALYLRVQRHSLHLRLRRGSMCRRALRGRALRPAARLLLRGHEQPPFVGAHR